MLIQPAVSGDANAIWAIMEPIIRAGETYTLARDMTKGARSRTGSLTNVRFSSRKTTATSLEPTACKRTKRAAGRTSPIVAT
jgi:hypothetical protein